MKRYNCMYCPHYSWSLWCFWDLYIVLYLFWRWAWIRMEIVKIFYIIWLFLGLEFKFRLNVMTCDLMSGSQNKTKKVSEFLCIDYLCILHQMLQYHNSNKKLKNRLFSHFFSYSRIINCFEVIYSKVIIII